MYGHFKNLESLGLEKPADHEPLGEISIHPHGW